MKFSSIAVTGLAGIAAANEIEKRYITTVEVECHEKTVTVPANGAVATEAAQQHSDGEHSSKQWTDGAYVTSLDYNWQASETYLPSSGVYSNPYNPAEAITADVAKWTDVMVPWTTAYVWPTAAPSQVDAVKAVYQHSTIITVINVHMDIEQHTVISTKTDVPPTSTPSLAPPSGAPPAGSQPVDTAAAATPTFNFIEQIKPPGFNAPQGTVHNVDLVAERQADGKVIVKYVPDRVNAAVGDVVMFKFKAREHSATQSTLDSPCIAATDSSGRRLFDSDLRLNADNQEGAAFVAPFYVFDVEPKWFYCKQQNQNHCGQGMVFGINPGDKMQQFIDKAIADNGSRVTLPVSTAPATSAAPSSVATDAAVVTDAVSSVVTDAPSSTGAAPAATSTVIVEGGITPQGTDSTLVFSPPTLENMKRGDTIKFDFRRVNHTLTESTLAEPCKRKEGGVDTGFVNVNPDGTPGLRLFDLVLDGEGPRYFYCKQANGRVNGHCRAGMVFAVNAGEQRFNQFVSNAKLTPVIQKRDFFA